MFYPRPYLFAILIAALGYAQEPPPIVDPEPAPSPIEAAWLNLEAPNAIFRSSAGLALSVRNLGPETVVPGIDIRLSRNGETVTRRMPLQPLGGFQSSLVPVNFTTSELGLANLQFSGGIYVAVAVTDGNGRFRPHAQVFPIFYHPDNGALLFYRRQALVSRYAGGDFRGTAGSGASAGTARLALQNAGLSVEPQLSRVSNATVTTGTAAAATGTKRFCLLITSDTFNDSSGRVWISPWGLSFSTNYGEDYGINDSPLPMARAYTVLSQNGSQIWAGFLDATGCTPWIAAASNKNTNIYYLPWYQKTGVSISSFVTDANLGDAVPSFEMVVPASNSPLLIAWMDPDEYAHSMFAAAAANAERYPGGQGNVLYEYRLRLEGDNTGTHASYSPSGHVIIQLKYSTAAKSKFTISHEYGHAIVMSRLNPHFTANDIDYSVKAGEASQHTWTSKEWQLVAAFEGYAQFVSGAVWNNVGTSADCKVVVGSDPYPLLNDVVDLNRFDRLFEKNYNENNHPDEGVEQDWAQFFWGYRTDVWPLPTGGLPTDAQIVNIFVFTWKWPKHQGFFADLTGGVSLAVPSPPGNPTASLMRFAATADAAGVNH